MSQKKLKKIRRVETKLDLKIDRISLPRFIDIIKNSWKFLLLITFLGFCLYANGVSGNFVSDDYATISQNPLIGSFKYTMSYASFGNSMNLTNYFVYKIFGNTSPIPYHLMSLLWFSVFNILAFVLIKLISKNDWVAKFTLLLFVFHPIHVEAVSWIAGRIYLILAVYILISVISFIYYFDTGKNKYLLLSLAFFIIAFCTDRPRPFGIFLIVALYSILIGWKNSLGKYTKFLGFVLVLGIIALVVSWPNIINRINIVNGGINATDGIFYNPFFQYPTAVANYLQLLYFPVDLTLYHTMYILPNWLNWFIFINYLALIIYFYFKDKRYFWALSFIFVSIAPSMSPVKVSWLVAERYMFLGSLGFCMFLGLLIESGMNKFRIVTPVLLISILIYYGVRTITRNTDWSTNHNLWVNTCQVSPNSHNAWNNIGDDYDKLKQYDNAVKGFTQSVLVKPNYADAYHNRANIFFKAGRMDLARESYEIAIKFSPSLYQTYLSLTQIDLLEKRTDMALFHASKAVEYQPGNPQVLYVLGVVNAQIGRIEEARNIFKTILVQFPDFQTAKNALLELNNSFEGKNK